MTKAKPTTTLPNPVVEDVLRTLHGVDDERAVALLSRFRYLQKLGFPAPKVGRGKKVAYRVDDLFQLALAFELLQMGVSPQRAVRLVRTGWPATRALLAQACADVSRDVLLTVFPRALDELAPEPGDELKPASDPMGHIATSDVTRWMSAENEPDLPRCFLINPKLLARRLEAALTKATPDADGVRVGLAEFAAAYAGG